MKSTIRRQALEQNFTMGSKEIVSYEDAHNLEVHVPCEATYVLKLTFCSMIQNIWIAFRFFNSNIHAIAMSITCLYRGPFKQEDVCTNKIECLAGKLWRGQNKHQHPNYTGMM
jgi:hypothetical protein